MSTIDEIKQRIDIVDLVGSYVQLQRAGRNYKGLCPFHTEKTPSFIVFPESQRWHCFGACSTGGDIFNFLMRYENLEFSEALRQLAERAGVVLEPLSTGAQEVREERDLLREINAAAAQFYHRLLVEAPQAEGARQYLARRGMTRETIETFQLGFAPDEWRALEGTLSRTYSRDDLVTAGLIQQGERGGYFDRFRNRVLFPIRDAQGHVIGFGGRVLDDSLPKYLNSPDTPLFDKGSVLYGLDLARQAIRESGTVVIVEGYMDVVIPYQCGVRNLVACLGTALTEAHIEQLRRMTQVLILALDPDAAGVRATERGIETAQQALERRTVPVLTASGLVRYESRLDTEIRVLVLPEGLDPDELVLQDRARWDRLVAEAPPVAQYFFDRVLAEEDLATAKGKGNAVDRLLPVIATIDNPAERHHYLGRLAQRLRVEEAELLHTLDRLRGAPGAGRGRPAQRARAPQPPPARPEGGAGALDVEGRVVALLFAFPALLPEAMDEARLSPDALADAENRHAYEALCAARPAQAVPNGAPFGSAAALSLLDSALRGHVESLLHSLEQGPDLSLDTAREDLVKSAMRLRQAHLSRSLSDLRFLQQDAQEEGDDEEAHRLNALIEDCRREYLEVHRQSYAVTLFGRSRRGSDLS
jgi:DNA primase